MKKLLFALCSLAVLFSCANPGTTTSINPTPMPRLQQQNGHYILYVDDKPFFMLGGQSGNSSNWPSMLPGVWETMAEMNANTLEIPIYWECVEPQQGQYDFSSVQLLLDQARERDIRLVLLWFATWKNGSNHYLPQWMKLDSKTYFNNVDSNGKNVDTPSPHCQATMELDAKAFTAFMQYLKDNDPCHTVIMVQVQNEPGSWQCVRDYSKDANALFNSAVPEALLKPEVLAQLETTGKTGTWSETFGQRADEYFNAWYVASYIEYVASRGKEVYDIPLYVNAALRDPFGNPTADRYESGGPTDNVIAVYKAAAPSISLVAPDIYQRGDANYTKVLELYNRPDNALMVPETSNQPKYLYEVVANGIGFSPFGVDGRPVGSLAEDYALLKPIADKLPLWQAEGRLYSAYQSEEYATDIKNIDLGGWTAVLTFGGGGRGSSQRVPVSQVQGRTPQTNGHALIAKMSENEFYCFGSGVRFSFLPSGKDAGKDWHYLVVEEGSFNQDGEWEIRRILNGDQTDWTGPMVNTATALHIKVYAREPRE